MRISQKITIAVILALITAYTGLWFYAEQHFQKLVTEKIPALEKQLSVKLHYASLEKTGYPFSLGIAVKGVKVTSPFVSLETEKLVVRSNLLATKLSLEVQGDIKENTQKRALLIRFKQNPTVTARLDKSLLLNRNMDLLSFYQTVTQAAYEDNGYVVLDAETQQELSRAEAMQLLVDVGNKQDLKEIRFTVKAEGVEQDALLRKQGVTTLPGKTDVAVEALFTIGKEGAMALDLKQCSMIAEHMRMVLKGSLRKDKNQFMPLGEIQIMLGNYTQLVDYFTEGEVNIVSREKNAAIKDFLKKAAGNIQAADLNFAIKFENNTIQIGALSLEEALRLYQENAAPVPATPTTGSALPAPATPTAPAVVLPK